MNDVGSKLANNMEALGDGFAQTGLIEAQRLSWNALRDISSAIKPGMTEKDAMSKADEILRAHGSPRSWHRTIVRFGSNTALPYWEKGTPDRILIPNELFFIDIGPNWILPQFPGIEYEGDVGNTYVAGEGSEEFKRCILTAKQLFNEASEQWRKNKLTGTQIYQWLDKRARKLGYEIVPEDDGHRIGDFPHKRIFEKGLTDVSFVPNSDLWVLEIHVVDPNRKFGAFFEDVLR